MYEEKFKGIRIDDWKAKILIQVATNDWMKNPVYIKGMLRLFPEWIQTEYESPTGEVIPLTIKYSSIGTISMAKLSLLEEGSEFFIKGAIERNYVNRTNPDFAGESKFKVNIEDIYLDNKNFFSNISNVAVLITS